MWLCEGKLKAKIAHSRLPSAAEKRSCFSSQTACVTGVYCARKFTRHTPEKGLI